MVRTQNLFKRLYFRVSGRSDVELRGFILERERTVRQREATILRLETEIRALQAQILEREATVLVRERTIRLLQSRSS